MKDEGWMKLPWLWLNTSANQEECLGAFMVCGLQHKATHESTALAVTTINLRHRWAIRRKNMR